MYSIVPNHKEHGQGRDIIFFFLCNDLYGHFFQDDRSTLFLIAAYARYNCPYVWVSVFSSILNENNCIILFSFTCHSCLGEQD